jgi:hypothetical protein
MPMSQTRSGLVMCARKVRFVVFQRELRVERSRMTNELTGGGNPKRDQSMLVKRQGWKSAYSSWRKVRSGMVKAELP